MRIVIYYILIYPFIASALDIMENTKNLQPIKFMKYKFIRALTKYNGNLDQRYEMNKWRYINLYCDNSMQSSVVVQTAFDNKTGLNVPIIDNLTAIVYYQCFYTGIPNLPNENQFYKFTKLCTDRVEEFYVSNKNASKNSSKTGNPTFLGINLKPTTTINNIKISFENCQENVKANFAMTQYRDVPSNFESTDGVFISNTTSIALIQIFIHDFFEKLGSQVDFVIQDEIASSCMDDSKLNSKYCSYLCKNKNRKVEDKCFVMIRNETIELPEESNDCPDEVMPQQKFKASICEYFEKKGQNPCKYSCIDLHKCSYMCVKENGSEFIEIGYEEKFLKTFSPSPIGSRQWSYENIPIDMVFINECKESLQLCQNYTNCIDQAEGYKCKSDDYTGKCASSRTNRFWHCPTNDVDNSSKVIKKYSPKHKNAIDNIFDESTNSTNKFNKLMDYYYTYFTNYTNTSQSGARANDSHYALKSAEKLLDLLISKELNDYHRSYYDDSDKGEVYVAYVNKTAKKLSIPLSSNRSDEKNQFVKLIFKDTVKSESSKNLVLKFLRYKNIDMMGESNELESKIKTNHLQKPDSMNTRNGSFNNANIYKNSDMFTLVITENKTVTVQFRMKTLQPIIKSDSWLYEFEEKCGYLDESSDHWSWSEKGCRKITTSIPNYCECDHLSNFAMMFAVKPINEIHLDILQYLSIMGGIVNVCSLLLFLFFIFFINSRDKLRLDQLNIALCLFFGTIIFLIGGFSSGNATLCKLTALVAQFLFLSAFVWKLIFGVNVVRMVAFLRFQNEDWMVKYRMVALVIGYFVPFLIVVVSGSLFWSSYGKVTDTVCWIETRSKAFLSFIIPVGTILAINLIALFYIANLLIRNYMKNRKIKVNPSSELMVFFQLVISMGITWVPSYFATVYVAAVYLFVIFFPLQGLFMFLIVVVMIRENSEKISTFVVRRYSSLISKPATVTDPKSRSKSKSYTVSKYPKQSESLLSESERGNQRDDRPNIMPMMTITDQNKSKDSYRNPAC